MEETNNKINPFWGNIFSSRKDSGSDSVIDVLRECLIFHKLSRRELKKISNIIYERKYAAGEHLFEKGQPGAAMFIIKKGRIKVVATDRDGGEWEFATLEAEDFVGELALLDDSPRSASARAVEYTEALAFFREDLYKLLDTNPEIASKIFKELAIIIGQRLKASNEQLLYYTVDKNKRP
jgi:CRP/FNR family transcriptional regulator, cyclic AMP receptor protein